MTIKEHIRSWYTQWLYVECLYSKHANRFHLTRASMIALEEIYLHNEGCSQKEICQVLSMPKQTVSNLMNGLESKQLVTKEKSKQDGRFFLYQLTNKGHTLCAEVINDLDKIEEHAFKQLSKEDLENFTRINVQLTKLIEKGIMGEDENGN